MKGNFFRHKGLAIALLKLVNVITGFTVTLMLSRFLGLDEFGGYVFLLSVATLIAVVVKLGRPQLIVRETAKAVVDKEWSRVHELWKWAERDALKLYCLVFAMVSLVYAAGIAFERFVVADVLFVAVIVLLLSKLSLSSARLRGLGFVVSGAAPELLYRPIIFIGLITSVYLVVPSRLTASTALMLQALTLLFVLGLSALILMQRKDPRIRRAADQTESVEPWRKSSYSLAVVGITTTFNQHVDIVLLGSLADITETAVYRVAAQLTSVMILAQTAINLYIAPSLATRFALGKFSSARATVRKYGLISFLFALLVYLSFAVFGQYFLELLFGSDYLASYLPFLILGLGQLVNAAVGPAIVALNMAGHDRTTARASLTSLGLNIVLNLILIPRYGAVGAAISTSASMIVLQILVKVALSRFWRQQNGEVNDSKP
ncbi:MAG: polysaccharide biosynthesis C-terminal domain-containing protein [Congregibacter sp.]